MGNLLVRHLDLALIHKMAQGWTPRNDPKPIKRQRSPRPEWTYRGYWRAAHRANRIQRLVSSNPAAN